MQLRRAFPGEARRALEAAPAGLGEPLRRVHPVAQQHRELSRILRVESLAGFTHDLRQAGAVGDQHRHAAGHRLGGRQPEAFVKRWQDEDGRSLYDRYQVVALEMAEAPQAEDAPAPEADNAIDTAADAVSDLPVESAEREPEGEVEEQEPALVASF